jgi:hypothetical protein
MTIFSTSIFSRVIFIKVWSPCRMTCGSCKLQQVAISECDKWKNCGTCMQDSIMDHAWGYPSACMKWRWIGTWFILLVDMVELTKDYFSFSPTWIILSLTSLPLPHISSTHALGHLSSSHPCTSLFNACASYSLYSPSFFFPLSLHISSRRIHLLSLRMAPYSSTYHIHVHGTSLSSF